MTSKIILKKSNVASKVPVAGDLDYGELALNYTDGKLWYKNNSNVITQLNAGLAGTVTVAQGGTGLTSYTANGIVYASDANTLATSSGLTFDGTSLKVGRLVTTAAATTNPVVIGRADSDVPTSVASISIGYNIGLIGNYSVSLGFEAAANGNGTDNFVVGQSAGQGGATGNTYSNSIIIGSSAGFKLTTGSENIYLGALSGLMNMTGFYNVCIGGEAGRNATGDGNSFLGNLAGKNVTTGSNNTIVGRFDGNQLGLNISALSNYIVLSDGSGNPRLYSDNVGNINIPSLTASKTLFTDASKNLTSTGTVAIDQGGTGKTSGPAAITALSGGLTAYTTAGGTTSITNTHSTYIRFIGSANQIMRLPSTTTLSGGWRYIVSNESSGTITVQAGTTAQITTIAASTERTFVVLNSVTDGPTSWSASYSGGQSSSAILSALGGGTGTVTSVGVSAPSIFTVGGSPVTGSGTIALTYSGTALPVANGGTGLTSYTLNGVPYANATSTLTSGTALTFNGTTLTVNSINIGRGGGSTANGTAVGLNALTANTGGSGNTALGSTSLNANTVGDFNVGVGYNSLLLNTTANNNTAIGTSTLRSNSTGTNNTAVGLNALYNNGIVQTAGAFVTTRIYTIQSIGTTDFTLIGAAANTVGTTFTATGAGTGTGTATPNTGENVAVGTQALFNNITGVNSVAVGSNAAFTNTTGNFNTSVGMQAGYTGGTGSNNTAVGFQSLRNNIAGSANAAFGYQALLNTTGSNNTAVGFGSGTALTTGSNNTIIGRFTGNQGGLDISTLSNHIVLSDGAGNPRLYSDAVGNIIVKGGSFQELKAVMGTNAIDLSTGNYFTKTNTGATVFQVSNVPAAGIAISFILDLTNGGSGNVTWWSGMKWAGGTGPALTASGRDVLGFFTHDGGTTWTGLLLGKDVK